MITVNHLRQFGVIKRQIQIAKEVEIEQANRLAEIEKGLEALAYQLIEANREDNRNG